MTVTDFGPVLSGRRLALLLGSNDYADGSLGALRCARADVDAMAELLADQRGGLTETVVLPADVTRSAVLDALSDAVSELETGDTFILYFSGHGFTDAGGRLYLALSDTDHNRTHTALGLDEIVAMLDNASPRKVALILDCCFGGAIATSFPSLKQIKDFWVVTAAGQDESAYEKEGSTHSILTGYLLDGLASGVADLDGSGYVSIAEAILYAQRLINALFAGQNLNQEPVLFLPTGARGELILGVAPARPERDHDRILKEDLDVFTVMSGIADLVSSGAPMQFRVMLQYYEIEGMSVRATMLTVSPDYTPNMRVHEDAVECDAFFAPDRLPDDFVAQRQVVDGKVRVRMRLPFWGIYMVIGTRDADLAKGDTDAVRLLERSPREAS